MPSTRKPTDDEERVLAYLYACEQTGKRPTLDNIDLPFERAEAAILGLIELGFIEPT